MADSILAGNFKKKTASTRYDVFTELLNLTYTSLNPKQIINAFIHDLRACLPLSGIEFCEASLSLNYIDGELSQHVYRYKLKFREVALGELSITAKDPLLKKEVIVLENKIAGLVAPLFHSIAYQQVVMQADRDGLTGLMSDSSCIKNMEIRIERAIDYQQSFSLLLINIDNLKSINIKQGYEVGDGILQDLVEAIQNELQSDDEVFRVAGDEFVVLLSDAEKFDAVLLAEEIKSSVLDHSYSQNDGHTDFSVSIGVVTAQPVEHASAMLDRANKALAHARLLGENRMQQSSSSENDKYALKTKLSVAKTGKITEGEYCDL